MATAINFKRGALFKYHWKYSAGTDGAATLSGCEVRSGLVLSDGRYVPLTVTPADDDLNFTMESSGSTAGWALGQAEWDVLVVNGDGEPVPSDTMLVKVGERISR